MPGVHSDVGGGYKKPLLSTISLLTMIDKMQERCPNIKFEEQYIKDVLLKIIIEEDVAVHNEFRDWKFITDLGYQRMAEKKHTNQFSHPLLSKLSGLEIDFKETRSRYSPCLLLQKGLSLPEIKFASGSHHGGKSMTDFFKRLEHSRPSGSAPGPISADSTNSKQELVHVACQGLET